MIETILITGLPAAGRSTAMMRLLTELEDARCAVPCLKSQAFQTFSRGFGRFWLAFPAFSGFMSHEGEPFHTEILATEVCIHRHARAFGLETTLLPVDAPHASEASSACVRGLACTTRRSTTSDQAGGKGCVARACESMLSFDSPAATDKSQFRPISM